MRCPRCGGETPDARRFCCDCGSRLDAGAPLDEIRTVTVLFADVAGSTAASARLGLEAVKVMMDRVFEVLYQVILQHGGTVDKYIGDCVMSLFGAPLAFGDDPARAVRAGLAIQRSLAEVALELEARGLPAVRMRVGINTGPVICGAVGAGPERRFTVLGHAVNIASHLQQVAPVGGVVVGEETARRIRGLFYTSPFANPHGQAQLVTGERAGGIWLRPREILGREIETVGRGRELDALAAILDACIERSESHLVIVSGEPGIGKSRLLFELFGRLERARPSLQRVVGFAHPLSAAVPFSVAAGAIRQGLGIAIDESPLEAVTKLHSLLAARGRPSLEADLALLSRLLGVGGGAPEGGEDPSLYPRRVLDLLADVVDWLTDRHPVLLVAEDLHWCDASSLALIEHLHARLAGKPLLLAGFTRPELLAERPELLEGARRSRIDLGPLDRSAVGELLVQAVGPEGDRLLELISSRALGNPYHVEELLRSLEERHILVRRIGGWDLRGLPDRLEIPPGVEAVTQARIDHLSPAQRRLFCEAAAVGRTFWDGLLHALDERFSASDLSTLVQRELVVPKQESTFRGQIEYSIVHDLTRDVAYRMLPEPRRSELHRRIAGWLLEQGAAAGTEELALVGRHLDLGGQPEEAAAYLSQAGDAAFAAAAYHTAAQHYGRALEIARAPKRLFDLLARRERVWNALGRFADQRQDAERMLALAGELGDESRVEALLRLGRAQLNVGELEAARQVFRDAYQRALDLGDADAQARSLRWLAMYHFNRSEHHQARAYFEQALQLADRHELESLAAELAYELGVTVGTIGDYPRALDVSNRALEMFRRQRNRYQEAFCLGNIGCFHVYLGEHEDARAVLERAAELGREMGLPLAEASAKANLGNALRLLGQPATALALTEEAASAARELGDPRLGADAEVYGALAALEAGDLVRAEVLARSALEGARRGSMPGTEAAAQMALARVLSRAGDARAAFEASAEAVAILDRIGSVEGFEEEILLVHGELCGRLDRREEAERSLRRAREEIDRKAAFIRQGERRHRFLRRAEALPDGLALPGESHGA